MSSRSGRRSRVKRGARGQRLVDDLFQACKSGQVGKAKKLLRKGADPNGGSSGQTPLITSSGYGHLDVVSELLKSRSIEVDCVDIKGCTALYAASQEGHSAVVKVLVEHGADPTLGQRTRGLPHCSLQAERATWPS